MKRILIALGVIVVAAVVLLLIGLMRPASHVASARIALPQSPQTLWRTLTDFESWPEWNSSITKMERREDRDGHPVWSFTGSWGEMPSRIAVLEPPERMVTHILEDADLGFSGSWEYRIEPVNEGAALTITERGRVDSVLFRALGIFHDNHATMLRFLTDLGKKFGEEVQPEVVE